MTTQEQNKYSTNKENPSGIWDLWEYMSELTGLSTTIEVEMKNVRRRVGYKNRTKLKDGLSSHNIVVIDKDGNRFAYIQAGQKRFDMCGIVAEKFLVTIRRPISDFEDAGVKIVGAGYYKDWEGDGYFKSPVSKVNDYYFAY